MPITGILGISVERGNMRKTVVLTDHGCVFRTGYGADELRGATMDCRCGRLLIFPPEATYRRCTRARDFHAYLHDETEPLWPVDGAGTGYVSF